MRPSKTVPAVLCVLLLAGTLHADDADLHTRLMRATVKISNGKSTGAGFVLWQPKGDDEQGRFLLVTAGHVFGNIAGNEATVDFRRVQPDATYRKVPTKLVLRREGKPRWTPHPSEDVAVIPVTPPNEADLPKVPVELLATDETLKRYAVHPGDAVYRLGYPHGVEANGAGFAVLRRGTVAGFPLVPTSAHRTFLVSTNVFEGDSGGPVYMAESTRTVAGEERGEVRLILGVVSRQHFLNEEAKMAYGSMKLRHRLGLAVVVPAPFIRETIARGLEAP